MNLEALNPKQREAALHINGPLLILAGAGSGKTRTLTYRVANLIKNGVSPYSILVMTFTNKAAKEMKFRINELVGERYPFMWVGTFHSICLRILQKEAIHLGYKLPFTIYSSSNQNTLIKQCLAELNYDKKKYEPKALLAAISKAKNKTQKPSEYNTQYGTNFTKVAGEIYELYQRKLKENNAMDFGDLIMNVVLLFKQYPKVLEQYQDRFPYLLVDEYQDTNNAQYQLIKMLSKRSRNLCVVGDDDQSIYGWRGADLANILDFEKDYPEALTIRLEQNYRSTGHILNAANSVIKNNSYRKHKKLWTDKGEGETIKLYQADNAEDEAYFVLRNIKEIHDNENLNWNDFAILYRTHAQSRALEDIFIYHNVPYQIYGGLRFYDRKEIQDILAYANLISNVDDDTRFTRIINTPKRGIGKKSVEYLANFAKEKNISLYKAALRIDEIMDFTAKTRLKFKSFITIISELQQFSNQHNVAEIIKEINIKSGYQRDLNALKLKNPVDAETRIENIDELENVGAKFMKLNPNANLQDFLDSIALESDVDNYEEAEENVTLMTLHAAKGLEFKVVFLIGLEDGLFPHSRALFEEDEMEEERRLCYVGVTRAQEKLFLTHALSRYQYGETKYNIASRFLREIPDESIEKLNNPNDDMQRPNSKQGNYLSFNSKNTGFAKSNTNLHVGDKVEHKHFGVGLVTDIGESLITINFNSCGEKSLHKGFVNLKKVTSKKSVNTTKQTVIFKPKMDSRSSNSLDFKIGEAVEHKKFGIGLIENIEGDFITILFTKVGRKKLSLTFASLKKVDKGE